MRQTTLLLLSLAIAGAIHAQGQPGGQVTPLPEVGKLQEARQMLGATVLGKRLYVLGGGMKVAGWTDSVVSAEILPNGFLGPFRDEQPMPDRRSYIHASTEVVNDRMYVIAGTNAAANNTPENQTAPASDVIWTRVQADGTLAPWRRSASYPAPHLTVATACSNDDHLYLLGGSAAGNILDRILVCDFAPDGDPINWRQIQPLPSNLWFHGATIIDRKMYIWGGLPQRGTNPANNTVFTATVNTDGSLGPWQREASQMPYPTYSATFCGFNDYLVCVAGRYAGGTPHNAIWYARLNNGAVGQWQYILTDLETRVYHGLGLDKSRGVVYIVGGRFRTSTDTGAGHLVDQVKAFQIPQPASARLTVAQPAAPPTAGAPVVQSGGSLALSDLNTALQQARGRNQQVLAFFYSPEVPASKRAADTIIQNPQFAATTSQMIVAGVDLSRGNTEFSYEYGVFKVPAFALLQADGTLVRKTTRLNSFADLQAFLAGN